MLNLMYLALYLHFSCALTLRYYYYQGIFNGKNTTPLTNLTQLKTAQNYGYLGLAISDNLSFIFPNDRRITLSYYESVIAIGNYTPRGISKGTINWAFAINNYWELYIDRIESKHNKSLTPYTLSFTRDVITLPLQLFEENIQNYLEAIHCTKLEGYSYHCDKVNEADYSHMPEFTIIVGNIRITIKLNEFVYDSEVIEVGNNKSISMNVELNVEDGNVIRIPLSYMLSQYILILDYTTKQIGFARIKTNWGQVVAFLFVILVIIMCSIYACESKAKNRTE